MLSTKSLFFLSILVLIGIFLSFSACASETPVTIPGVSTIEAGDLQTLQSKGAAIVDARIAAEYAEAHIKGAVSVPYHEQSKKDVDFDAAKDDFNVSKLPADKTSAVVLYCNGPTCWKSYKSVLAAKKEGYTNLYWYRSGFTDWQAKKLPVE